MKFPHLPLCPKTGNPLSAGEPSRLASSRNIKAVSENEVKAAEAALLTQALSEHLFPPRGFRVQSR